MASYKSILEKFSLAEQMRTEADAIYYRAKKELEAISSPALPHQSKKGKHNSFIAEILMKRNRKIHQQ